MGLPRSIVSLSQKGLDRLWGLQVIMWAPGTRPLALSHTAQLCQALSCLPVTGGNFPQQNGSLGNSACGPGVGPGQRCVSKHPVVPSGPHERMSKAPGARLVLGPALRPPRPGVLGSPSRLHLEKPPEEAARGSPDPQLLAHAHALSPWF